MQYQAPPGPAELPLFGSAVEYAEDPLGFMAETARRYGDVARFELGGREVYLLTDPEAIGRVLVSNEENYRKPDSVDRPAGELLGSGLLTSEGEHWREQRGRMQPAFYRDKVAGYAPAMVERTEDLLESWHDGQRLDVHRDMAELTLHIVVDALFGADLAGMERAVGEALQVAGEQFRPNPVLMALPDGVPTPGERRYQRAIADLERVLRDVLRQHERGADVEDGEDDETLLSILTRVRDAGLIDGEQVRDELMTMLLAGHDTTALSLTYAWYLLSKHPERERRFHDELDRVLDGAAPTAEDVPDLAYTQQVVKESMRLYPPVYSLFRESNEADTLGGYHVPADTLLFLPQWVVHRDPRFYDAPQEFRPERWTPEFEAELPTYAYFPFGGGPRRCIGNEFATMEATLVLATVGSRYALDLVDDGPLDLAPSLTVHPENPVEVTVHER
jgi:cytochrome P450